MRRGVRHPIFARFDAWLVERQERAGAARHRCELLAGARGSAIEIGAGSGVTFRHYPPEVSSLLAVEPEPYLRARAVRAAMPLPLPIRVVDGLAHELPAPDASLDIAVASLVLCSVTDQSTALREIYRVLRPGGELRFYEHVRSQHLALAAAQRGLDVAWPAFAGGCHTSRDTAAAIEQAGFEDLRYRRLTFRPCVLLAPIAPIILGIARRR